MPLYDHNDWRKETPGILFAEDFDDDELNDTDISLPVELVTEPQFSAAEIEMAQQDGYAQGRQAALAEIASQQKALVTETLCAIRRVLEQREDEASAAFEQASDATSRLLFETLAATLPSLRARHDAAEIASMVHDLVAGMTPETRVILSVACEVSDEVRSAVMGLPPVVVRRVVIEPRDGMAPGDALLSWGAGSAARSSSQAEKAVNEILRRFDLLPQLASPALRPTTAAIPTTTTFEKV